MYNTNLTKVYVSRRFLSLYTFCWFCFMDFTSQEDMSAFTRITSSRKQCLAGYNAPFVEYPVCSMVSSGLGLLQTLHFLLMSTVHLGVVCIVFLLPLLHFDGDFYTGDFFTRQWKMDLHLLFWTHLFSQLMEYRITKSRSENVASYAQVEFTK